MKTMKNKKTTRRLAAFFLATPLAMISIARLEAAELNVFGTNGPPVDFHGFVSQGFLDSSKYNYLCLLYTSRCV